VVWEGYFLMSISISIGGGLFGKLGFGELVRGLGEKVSGIEFSEEMC